MTYNERLLQLKGEIAAFVAQSRALEDKIMNLVEDEAATVRAEAERHDILRRSLFDEYHNLSSYQYIENHAVFDDSGVPYTFT